MKSMRLVAAAAFLVLAACSSSATEPAATRADRPSFDGGNGMGSGNVTDEDGGGMMGSGNDGQATTTSADSTGTVDGRGINTMGSGG
jgi:Spy/CpxP family protein refolding chaperone